MQKLNADLHYRMFRKKNNKKNAEFKAELKPMHKFSFVPNLVCLASHSDQSDSLQTPSTQVHCF